MGALAIIFVAGLVGMFIVFTQGLVVTNLTDLVPWGLWITIDLSAIALGAGAFLLCAAVYILNLKQFLPITRTATFIGFIGYSVAMLMLLLDIGRPDRFWHSIVYWNTHSVLWEVSMCIVLYFTVLILEVAPLLGRLKWIKNRFPWVIHQLERLHHLAPILAVIGLFLSMLHQSSLGAAYGVLKARPIWYRPGLSVLFILSAMAGGPALTVFASKLAARFSPKARINRELLDQIASFVGWVLIGYLYFRFWDAMSMTYTYLPGRNEGLDLLTRGPLAINFWVGEILLGALIPIIILRSKKLRQNWFLQMAAMLMVIGGVVAYRWDVNMAGELTVLTYLPNEIEAIFTTYTPSAIEILTGVGAVAYALLAFTIGVRYLGVVDQRPVAEIKEVAFQESALVGTD
jgi:Ni/Fe-hydrogenase subunit HybB-like protein